MSPQTALAECVLVARDMFVRGLDGFDESNRTTQTPDLPNHLVWNLGHCALTMHRAAERADGEPLPETDFVIGNGTAGDTNRFDAESVSFGSKPTDDSDSYPTLARAREIFEAASERLAQTIRAMSAQKLDEKTTWGVGETTIASLMMRMCFHTGAHAGQVLDLRRSLHLPALIRPKNM